MKKLLSILTISTLTASVPAPLLANTSLERAKRDVNTLLSNANNNYLPLTKINGISAYATSLAVDSKDNIYFSYNVGAMGAYVLKHGSDTPTKINGIDKRVNSLAVDSKDNIYFGTSSGAFVFSSGGYLLVVLIAINTTNK